MARATTSRELRERRHLRVRKKVVGTAERPRLSVFRSLQHVYAQVIDDTQGATLAAASTLEADLRGQLDGKSKSAEAELVGQLIAQRARERGVERVVFDRGGYQYHGRVKALAEAARAAGLSF
ncbi:MAG: 50S ribosomal protein L18 [Chloroflexi bacterium]|nr:50S ribosomal protein L18 [Chloroflexota bacterium]MCL5109922.1 50S ribosomal protein L18 [Chloroflexota bacterium]